MAVNLRRMLRALGAAALLVGSALGQELTILSVNDTHSHLDAFGPKDANLDGTIGGLVKAAAVIAELRATEPNPVFLHAGDLFLGDMYFNATLGVSELQLLRLLGLDAMAVGNHELWLGSGPLALAYGLAFPGGDGFPLLAANVDPAPLFVEPRVTLDVDGVKVGVFGLVTPYDLIAQQAIAPDPRSFVGWNDPHPPTVLAGIAAAQVAALRDEEGAQVVIMLSHLGGALDEALATLVPGIDAVVGGHDHAEFAKTVVGPAGKVVPIVHTGAYYAHVGKVRLSVGTEGVSVLSTELVDVDQRVPRPAPEPGSIAEAVKGIQAFVAGRFADILLPQIYGDPYHTPIAFAEDNVTNRINMKVPKRDSGTGNLVTDAVRASTGADVAFTVSGQTPQGIAAGPVVSEDLFRMVGLGFDAESHFGWRIATFDILGAEIIKALETTIPISLQDDDFIVQVSGMKYVYDSSLPAPPRLVSVEIGGAPLDSGRTYSAAVNELVYRMLPSLGVTIVPGTGQLLDTYEFSAIRDHVVALGAFSYSGENRVRDLAARGDARNAQ